MSAKPALQPAAGRYRSLFAVLFLASLCFAAPFPLPGQEDPGQKAAGQEPTEREQQEQTEAEAPAAETSRASGGTASRTEAVEALFPTEELTPAERRAFLRVSRAPFLPEELSAFAGQNRSLPLSGKAVLPSHSLALTLLRIGRPEDADRVLITGAGCGYLAALFAAAGAEVTVAESEPALREQYPAVWEELGVAGITVIGPAELAQQNLQEGFSAVIIHGIVRSIPPLLFELKTSAGVLAAPLTDGGGGAMLIVYRNGRSPELRAVPADLFPAVELDLGLED
jgi:protein-L-isoaspartate(D-aspartate) O-methyltransferase